MDQGLFQEQVAEILGVTEQSITNWELGHSEPEVSYVPKIIDFIGYCPYNPAGDLIDRMRALRLAFGFTQEKMSKILGVDESSLASWERREHQPINRSQKVIREFLATPDYWVKQATASNEAESWGDLRILNHHKET